MSTDDVILSNDCMSKSPVGYGKQSKNICVKNIQANTTSRNTTDLSQKSSQKKKNLIVI